VEPRATSRACSQLCLECYGPSSPNGPREATLEAHTHRQERKIIEAALTECKGKVAGPERAGAKLEIPRSTLDWKIKQLRIKKHRFISE
jgi:transcriptional regulator with GAF, ATPase, and Fis domain